MINDIYTKHIIDKLDRIERTVSNDYRERWINIRGASAYSSLSIPKLRRAITNGELEVSKVAGKLLFKREWIDKWLNNKKNGTS